MCECSSLNIPDHLWHNGREIINDFSEEHIYRRFRVTGSKEEWLSDKALSAAVFNLNSDSYNRSKFSTPEDVLYNTRVEDNGNHYFNWGILGVPCDELSELQGLDLNVNNVKRSFTLNIVHSPVKCMYPHSELLVYENGDEVNVKAPKSIGVLIRDFLIKKSKIIKDPDNTIDII